MFFTRKFRRVVSLIVSLSLLLISPYPLLAERRPTPQQSAADFKPDFNLLGLQAQDPMFKKFADSPWTPPQWGPFDANDPVLDQDPFFMRSQSYRPVFDPGAGEGTAYRSDQGAIEIQVPGAKEALRIEQPLAPLFEIENFLVLQANDPQLFAGKAISDDYYGEGLFFIDKRYIYTELKKPNDHRPVPIFFLPLSGRGWTGKITRLAFAPNFTFALRTEGGEQTTIDLTQLTQLAQLLHNHVVISTLIALKSDTTAIQKLRGQWLAQTGEKLELPFAYPPRGSTAAFGLMVSGVDLDHPDRGLFPVKGARSSWNLDILPKAQASDLLTPDVLSRLLVVASITGTTFVLGWVAQYTILRKRMLERRALIEGREDKLAIDNGKPLKDRTGIGFKVVREAKESIDVFSHGLASLSSGFGVTLGFLMEYGADRFLGRQGQSVNGMIRWFMEKTFLYGRQANELIGASWKTFILGVVILGGIDTISVVLQLLYVSPIFFPFIGYFLGPDKEQQAIHEFSGKDADTNNIVTSEIMRNLTGYFVSGAYAYSSSQRIALLEIVKPEVERQMIIEGKKDFGNPEIKKELEKRIEARLELMLVERGLPNNDEFLFSGPSLVRSIAHFMGYKVDRNQLYQSSDYVRADGSDIQDPEEKAKFLDKKDLEQKVSKKLDSLMKLATQFPENKVETDRFIKASQAYKNALVRQIEKALDNETFVLEKARWGIISHALKRALGAAIELSEQEPNNPRLKAAVQILQETKRKYHVVWNVLRNPLKVGTAFQDAYTVREMLTILSREDAVVGTGVKFLDLWDAARSHPEAALIAGRLYRQSFFSLIQDNPELVKPTADDAAKYLPEAREEAVDLIRSAPGKIGYDDQDIEVVALEIVKTKVQAEQRKLKAQQWKPAVPDVMEVPQREHAHREALVKVIEATRGEIEPDPLVEQALRDRNIDLAEAAMTRVLSEAEQTLVNHPEAKDVYREAYRKALAENLDLQTLPPEQSQLVRKTMDLAASDIEANLKSNQGWIEHLKDLDEVSKIRFLTHQYADSFLAKYAELTVSNSAAVSLTSPEQPGFFQRLRQWPIAQKDTWLGRTLRTTLRALESPMDTTAYRPGLNNWLRRNIPWWQDGKTTIFSDLRIMWTALTIGYAVQYNVWQVKFTWPQYMFFFWTAAFGSIIHYWVDRLMMNMGIRPMQTTWGKVKYSLFYTWLTYPTYLPFFFYVKDFTRFWDTWVTQPLGRVLSPVVQACEHLLSTVF